MIRTTKITKTRRPSFSTLRVFMGFVVLVASAAVLGGQASSFKIAFYNIRSGKGSQPLRGRAAPFAETDNCADTNKPVNAWGAGVVQKELTARAGADPAVIALGLAEAWNCASPPSVKRALGWNAATEERNGIAIVARHGIKGSPRWVQLDTSHNSNPKDTMWVVGAAVCLAADCRNTIDIYATHW